MKIPSCLIRKPPDQESEISITGANLETGCNTSDSKNKPFTARCIQLFTGFQMQKIRAWSPSEETLYNMVLGITEGLATPLTITASLASVADVKVAMLAGLAEVIAGAISMVAGGILGAKSEVQKYQATREALNVVLFKTTPSNPLDDKSTDSQNPPTHIDEIIVHSLIYDSFAAYLPPTVISQISACLCSTQPTTSNTFPLSGEKQIDFLLQFTEPLSCLNPEASVSKTLQPPSVFRPPTMRGVWKIGLVLGLAYTSGLIPLIPYIAVQPQDVMCALWISVGITVVMLAGFGYGKTALTLRVETVLMTKEAKRSVWEGKRRVRRAWKCVMGAVECLLVVGLSAGISVVFIKGIGGTLR